MNRIILIISFFIGFVATSKAQSSGNAIIGSWTNEAKDAKFEIYRSGDEYLGKIIWGKGGETKDVKNPDPKLKSRDIIGSVILNGFVFIGDNIWEKGTIYDPREGKTYSCKITLKSKDQINVRGYVGFSMFGRTEVWTRINN